MLAYHDREWGIPHHDDRALFELLTLEGAQAGLSWRTILARRDAYRRAYHDFDIKRIAGMRDSSLEKLLAESGIIRNRLKVYSVRDNARVAQIFFWMCSGIRATSPNTTRWACCSTFSRAASSAVPSACSISLSTSGFE